MRIHFLVLSQLVVIIQSKIQHHLPCLIIEVEKTKFYSLRTILQLLWYKKQ